MCIRDRCCLPPLSITAYISLTLTIDPGDCRAWILMPRGLIPSRGLLTSRTLNLIKRRRAPDPNKLNSDLSYPCLRSRLFSSASIFKVFLVLTACKTHLLKTLLYTKIPKVIRLPRLFLRRYPRSIRLAQTSFSGRAIISELNCDSNTRFPRKTLTCGNHCP